ncbi:MAG: hypothetical protein JWR01_68 [Subtercola sp.]|nr:hypothetical protein [Subtercola sp.]
MTVEEFRVWSSDTWPRYCGIRIDYPLTFPDELMLTDANIAPIYPPDVIAEMDTAHKKNNQLADNVYVRGAEVVVSGALRQFLEGEQLEGVEFLPLSITDFRGRVASSDYFIVQVRNVVDAIDPVHSEFDLNLIDPEVYATVWKLVIDNDAVPASIMLFRPRHRLWDVLVRTELAAKIEEAGFTGLRFSTYEQFVG